MTTAVFAAVAGVLGVIAGRLWDTRSEVARWKRDKKVLSYGGLIERYDAVLWAIWGIAAKNIDDPVTSLIEQQPIDTNSSQAWTSWTTALGVVWLHGSPDVVSAATNVDRAMAGLYNAALTKKITTAEQWIELRRPTHVAFETFLEAARRELRLPLVPFGFYTDFNEPFGF
ncbi:hypothetical protein ACFXHA_36420 [Nocardia sp. NPDC059240]|uniref:hypothetical protein n=1 Tax=Nocardia sp. NPDC059240 TaxID=3346786 RepID=UPI0036843DD8